MANPAVFLDRDGVLVPDDGAFDANDVRLLDEVPASLARLHAHGFTLIVVSNQTIIARGLAVEADVIAANELIRDRITVAGGPRVAAFYFCPHHPNATLDRYRFDCDCRKPSPGLLRRAAAEHALDLNRSFMIGDRITDVIAGAAAGCRTILVETGRHLDPPIETAMPIDTRIRPDYVCAGLAAAADWILTR